jgi:hypothetical protein
VRPGAVTARTPPTWAQLGTTWFGFVAIVLIVAAAVHAVAPDWLGDGERELPDRALLIVDIFVNNLLIAALPVLGGWLAAGHLVAGRTVVALLLLLAPGAVVARSLVTVGAVGGADPLWLADAARWWLLEIGALAVAARTGLWLAANPRLREEHGPAALRRALSAIVSVLAVAASVEVLTA